MNIAALVILAVVAIAMLVWNVGMQVGHDDDRPAREQARAGEREAIERLVALMVTDLQEQRKAVAVERKEHVAQLQSLLAQQAEERKGLLAAALSPSTALELTRLEATAEQEVRLAEARERAHIRRSDEAQMERQERQRAEAAWQDVTN